MSSPSRRDWVFDGEIVAVLADCHIHPGGGPAFPEALFDALADSDLIVALGDMGEAAGLNQLAEIAPVIGVRGADDSDDLRTAAQSLVIDMGGGLFAGCVFDAKAAGLATSSDPFVAAPDFDAAARRLFGREVGLLLHASTHKGEIANWAAGIALNPGSAVLPAEGFPATFLRLSAVDGVAEYQLVTVS
ncbi:metallophosphoesterase family protein [Phenylobacterium sp.]|uniref:metallophosphoesterase family protein n=1 Tax=Phenylobacterium sp. TaxID=1871053 RepID=UPI0035655CA1